MSAKTLYFAALDRSGLNPYSNGIYSVSLKVAN